MLRDLFIKNYRCFEDFKIDGLEQVNLFVGNNNSGKTSLLEAIYLLVNQNKILALIEILLFRGEIIKYIYDPNNYRINSSTFTHIKSIKHIFHNHRLTSKDKIEVFSSSDVNITTQIFSVKVNTGILINSCQGENKQLIKGEFLNININHELDLTKFEFPRSKDPNSRHVYI